MHGGANVHRRSSVYVDLGNIKSFKSSNDLSMVLFQEMIAVLGVIIVIRHWFNSFYEASKTPVRAKYDNHPNFPRYPPSLCAMDGVTEVCPVFLNPLTPSKTVPCGLKQFH
ncbi:hypothetical protein AVEN_116612-1 [Araneus ventricosus]|uniref:Uncharacterized protein n=1 Tax=Araneus ventricosus TaxID=182803 RepID=A0A4Y2DE77_ARAVE|nr:hypothetical protein AVEN_116612-1 [Araneus ventricosus]